MTKTLRFALSVLTSLSALLIAPWALADEALPAATGFLATPAGKAIAQYGPLVLLGVVFYLFIIRPQMKRNKAHRELMSTLAVGNEITTSAGIYGVIRKLDAQQVVIEVDFDTKATLTVQRGTIASILPEGTFKAS